MGFFAVILLLLLIFILQNNTDVSVSYLGMHGHLPLGVALLLAAVCGVLLVVLAGTARIGQLRATARRRRKVDAQRALRRPRSPPTPEHRPGSRPTPEHRAGSHVALPSLAPRLWRIPRTSPPRRRVAPFMVVDRGSVVDPGDAGTPNRPHNPDQPSKPARNPDKRDRFLAEAPALWGGVAEPGRRLGACYQLTGALGHPLRDPRRRLMQPVQVCAA